VWVWLFRLGHLFAVGTGLRLESRGRLPRCAAVRKVEASNGVKP
jgi:hypothetical protein